MNVYFIPGLGADSRVFRHIVLPAPHQAIYLEWSTPAGGESLHAYAMRMANKIDASQPFGLVGLSMGGMIASEIARSRPAAFTVLLSSIPAPDFLPAYFRWAGALKLDKLVPVEMIKRAAFSKRKLSRETSEDKAILIEMIRDCDPLFMRWAMRAILEWKAPPLHASYTHIHGTRDAILPVRFTKPTHRVKGAGHLMVMTHFKTVNQILETELR